MNTFPLIVMAIFDNLTQPFETLSNELIGNPILIGATILIFVLMFALLMLVPYEAMAVVMIPTCYAVFEYIPQLRIIVAIVVGFIIGFGLLKWVRR